MELSPGVHRVDVATRTRAFSNAYLVVAEREAEGLTLVDTGTAGMVGAILRAVAGLGYAPADVRRIVLTHYHMDHVGGAAELVRQTGAYVLAHADEAPLVEGQRPALAARRRWGRMIRALTPLLGSRPTPVNERLTHGDVIPVAGGMRVIHTPGHTPGSICLHLSARGVLFTGDTLLTDRHGSVEEASPLFSLDIEQARASARALADLDFDVLAPGHGLPVVGDASAAVRRMYAKATHG